MEVHNESNMKIRNIRSTAPKCSSSAVKPLLIVSLSAALLLLFALLGARSFGQGSWTLCYGGVQWAKCSGTNWNVACLWPDCELYSGSTCYAWSVVPDPEHFCGKACVSTYPRMSGYEAEPSFFALYGTWQVATPSCVADTNSHCLATCLDWVTYTNVSVVLPWCSLNWNASCYGE